jgi:hypothetical protein
MPRTTKSPTQRTMAEIRKMPGYELVQIVEHFNGWGKCRQDLFGFIDVLAIIDGQTVGIQVTAAGVTDRIKKIQTEAKDACIKCLKAGWRIEVHGWRKIQVPTSKGGSVERYMQRRILIEQGSDGELFAYEPEPPPKL